MKCGEAIFNLLCPNCIAKEIEIWMNEINLAKKIKEKIRNEIKKLLINDKYCVVEAFEKCVVCNKPTTNYCPYCFTEIVYSVIKKNVKNVSERKKILKSYFTYFNFDFEHTGYTKEMEKLGML